MKVALVHDYLMQDGGAEKVLEIFSEIFPHSPIYVLFYNEKQVSPLFENKEIRTSFLQKWLFSKKRYQWYLPFMPSATEHFDLREFDVVISSTSAFAKGIITSPHTLHICYCHTPTRYLWTDTHDYIKELKVPKVIKRWLPLYLNKLRMWDYIAAQRVDTYIANSYTVQKRIKKYYNRESIVINPPIELSDFEVSPSISDYYLTGGRLVPYKRFDLAIKACNELGKKLKIFGEGPELEQLKKIAGPTIEFVGKVSNNQRKKLYAQAKAFIHPQEEDFGLTQIESLASGRPVIAYKKGGATEIITDKVNGIFFHNQTILDIKQAIIAAETHTFNTDKILSSVEKYSRIQFKNNLINFVNESYNSYISSL